MQQPRRSAPLRPVARARAVAFVFGAALLAACLPAPGAELYGRPLRGLSAVPAAEVAKSPAKWAGRSVRVEGTLRRGAGGAFTMDGVLPVRPEAFSLPSSADGRVAAAEGKVVAEGDGGALVAAGVEIQK